MADQNLQNNQLTSLNIENITFDSFGRNRHQDIVCVAPIRTIVRREEEIVLIRRVRKVEEIDASQACPLNTRQVGELRVDAKQRQNLPSLTNESNKPVAINILATGIWDYGYPNNSPIRSTAEGNPRRDRQEYVLYRKIFPGALVTVKRDGHPVAYGENQSITLHPGETIGFIINDEPGDSTYNDNTGTLTVAWSVDGGDSSLRIIPGTVEIDINEWSRQTWRDNEIPKQVVSPTGATGY